MTKRTMVWKSGTRKGSGHSLVKDGNYSVEEIGDGSLKLPSDEVISAHTAKAWYDSGTFVWEDELDEDEPETLEEEPEKSIDDEVEVHPIEKPEPKDHETDDRHDEVLILEGKKPISYQLGDAEFPCPEGCDKKYSVAYHFTRHMKKVHGQTWEVQDQEILKI